MLWDEENRLTGINDDGKVSIYSYDATGERVVKSTGGSQGLFLDGTPVAALQHQDNYTAYVNPYLVVQKGRFTKHYFAGSQRISSKIGLGTFVNNYQNGAGITAGNINFIEREAQLHEQMSAYYASLGIPPGPPTQKGVYAPTPYPQSSSDNSNAMPPLGWPRSPVFNEPGDVPGPPVQFGPDVTNQTIRAGFGFIPVAFAENDRFYFHPDHLGSSNYITNQLAQVSQHVEYMAFGESLLEEHLNTAVSPYLFNGKERDAETGLYYYGARYYNPKTSYWLSVDPLAEQTMTPYQYVNQNPINLIDPTGMSAEDCPDCGNVPSTTELDELVMTSYIGKSFFGRIWDGIKSTTKSVFGNRSKSTVPEPDFLNIGSTGLDIGLGVKNFKFGNLGEISLDVSLGSLKYDPNRDGYTYSLADLTLGTKLGPTKLGGEVGLSLLSGGFTNENPSKNFYELGTLSRGINFDNSLNANITLGEVSVFGSKKGWLQSNSFLSPVTPANRMVSDRGIRRSMNIIGGELNYGVGSTNVEINIDEIMSNFLGGSGFGDNWKKL